MENNEHGEEVKALTGIRGIAPLYVALYQKKCEKKYCKYKNE
jgi:hypothetical protein